jgi:predicted DNA-binding ribbon-helix-helix protein
MSSPDRDEPDDSPAPPGRIIKHSLSIAGHRTSISLEAAFWKGLREASQSRHMSLAALVAEIDATRGEANLSSAIRVFVLDDAQRRNTAANSQ